MKKIDWLDQLSQDQFDALKHHLGMVASPGMLASDAEKRAAAIAREILLPIMESDCLIPETPQFVGLCEQHGLTQHSISGKLHEYYLALTTPVDSKVAGKRLQLSRSRVGEIIREGKLAAKRGRHGEYLVDPEEILKYARTRSSPV